jgi:glutamate/tyrosine decarboxylase-like PLP-dependent enzyme
MCTDLTMSSLLGYFMTMLYNPNNVALEASPMTTLVELRVGQQLCKLFGYNTDTHKSPVSWGHITCDGTIANLESIWVGKYSHPNPSLSVKMYANMGQHGTSSSTL